MKKVETVDTKRGQRIRVCTINTDPDKTDQSQAADCDINNIVKRYKKTGQISHLAKTKGVYADLSLMPSTLIDAHELISQASNAFNSLPAQTRKKFGNDPEQMIQFINDPNNADEAIKLGLLVRKNPPETGTNSEGNRPETKTGGRGQSSKKQKNNSPRSNDDDSNDDDKAGE